MHSYPYSFLCQSLFISHELPLLCPSTVSICSYVAFSLPYLLLQLTTCKQKYDEPGGTTVSWRSHTCTDNSFQLHSAEKQMGEWMCLVGVCIVPSRGCLGFSSQRQEDHLKGSLNCPIFTICCHWLPVLLSACWEGSHSPPPSTMTVNKNKPNSTHIWRVETSDNNTKNKVII